MEVIIFCKPIFDMLYSIRVLDYALLLVLFLFFPIAVKKNGRHVLYVDICVMLLIAGLTITFLRTFSGVDVYLKMVTAYMMYFAGRGFSKQYAGYKKALVRAQIIVLDANLICLLLGQGFTIWGNARTFRGLFFYKTDLAIAMIQALTAVLFFDRNRIHGIVTVLLSGIMVVLSNSRASIIIFMVVLLVYILFIRERKTNRVLRINMKFMMRGILVVLLAFVLTVGIISLPIFKNLNFISFDVSNLFSTENLQGRDDVWKGILADFNAAGVLQRIFGVDFISDVWVAYDQTTYDSHNSYIKILFSTGYAGLGLFFLFLVLYIVRLNRVKDRALFYFCLSSLTIFLLQGISQASIAFTQMTWIWMFFAGVAVSMSRNNNMSVEKNKEH